MALARIFSCSPHQAAALIHDLERQGYKVEVLHPDEIPSGPADLEIQYELVDSSAIVERAQELAAQHHADVAVDVGILQPAYVEPQPAESPGPLAVDRFSEANLEPEEQAAPATIWQEHEETPVQETWSHDLSPSGVPETEQQETPLPLPVEPIQVHFSPPLKTPETAEIESSPEPAQPHPLAVALSGASTAIIAFAGNLLHSLGRLWQEGLQKMREQRQRASIRWAETRAHREQRMLELTCRRAEVLRHSRQVEAARRAAAGYLSQLQRETGAHAHEEADPVPPAPVASPRSGKKWRIPAQHVKSLAAGAAAAGVLFALTLGISTLRTRHSSSDRPAAPSSPPAAEPGVPTGVAQPTQVPSRPSPAVHKAAQKSAARTGRPSTSRPGEDDGNVADDVVVRHFSQPPHKLQSRVSGSVKRYSDLDN